MPRKATYIDADLKPIVDTLDQLWLSGRRKDIATIITYAAHRLADSFDERNNTLGKQLADFIADEAVALSEVQGGD